jgi:carboxymethylenebutenolidase
LRAWRLELEGGHVAGNQGTDISIDRPDGTSFPAYLSAPVDGPGIVVCHAYWGLTDHYRRLCDRLAAEGFPALAPSLYDGASTDDPAEAEKLMATVDENEGKAEADLGIAFERLLEERGSASTRFGVVGFSLGGWAATRLAVTRPEIRAVVPFYGYSAGADYKGSSVAAQGHFANVDDDEIDPAAFETLLREAGREVEIHRYAAPHGFFNEDHPGDYDEQAATASWTRMLAFLRAHLT